MSVEAALDFFLAMFGGNEVLEKGYITITDIGTHYSFHNNLRRAAEEAVEIGQKKDVYFGTGIYGKPLSGSKVGTEKDIIGRSAFVIDADVAGPGHKKQNLVGSVDEAIEILKVAFPLFSPSIVNVSGGGCHCYYLFKQPVFFTNDEERKAHKELSTKFFQTALAAYRSKEFDLDNVSNLNRILRVPGTFNHKNGGMAPVWTKVMNTSRTILPEDILPFVKEGAVQERIREVKETSGGNTLNIIVNENAEPPYEKMEALLTTNARFKAAWNKSKGIAKEFKESMSSLDMILANIAKNADWTDQEVANLIIAFRRIKGNERDRRKGLRADYLCITINRAKDKLKRSYQLEEIAQQAKDAMHEEDEEKKEEMKQDVYEGLRQVLGVTINEVRMYVGDEVHFELVVNGITCPIGPTSKMFSQKHVLEQISVVAKEFVHGFDKRDWPNIVTIMLKNAVEIQADTCMTETGMIAERIKNYIDEVVVAEDKNSAYQSGCPFTHNGDTYIFIGHFRSWLANKGDKTETKALGIIFNKLGHKAKIMGFRKTDGTKTTRWTFKLAKDENDTGEIQGLED